MYEALNFEELDDDLRILKKEKISFILSEYQY